jgi:predicted DNA-binding helix-hairpin-helix protein
LGHPSNVHTVFARRRRLGLGIDTVAKQVLFVARMSRITSADLKELQGLIAFKACETFVYRKGESKRKKVLQQELGQIFHGDARSNIASG